MSNWTRARKSMLCRLDATLRSLLMIRMSLCFYSCLTQELELTTAQDSFKTIRVSGQEAGLAIGHVAFDRFRSEEF